MTPLNFQPGTLVRARGREWVVMPDSSADCLALRPLGGGEDIVRLIPQLERSPVEPAIFPLPDPDRCGTRASGRLLRDALMLRLRAGAGPFRSFGHLAVEPRAYQLVPLLMALKLPVVRLLIADDVGIGKTIEAGLIARELLDRGEIARLTVLCPPHLCEQWQAELQDKFHLQAEIVRTSTAPRLERGLPLGQSLFDVHPFTVVSLDYIKSDRRRDEFQRACPELVIVDEAHACVQGSGSGRHQRFQLLRGLAGNPDRHLLLLTATPHSGDEEAFYNLLGLLDRDFLHLRELQGREREKLRQRLGSHFVQRRRADIDEWRDAGLFPDRLSREVTYTLTGAWKSLFDDILEVARELVRTGCAETEHHRRRMHWWAALALMRCVSSSPAAAAVALRTRLLAESPEALEQLGWETVMDTAPDDPRPLDDTTPAAQLSEQAQYLEMLLADVEKLTGPRHDPKLAILIEEIRQLLADDFQPVIFCRYIATAHYLADHLRRAFSDAAVAAVTGELTPSEREEAVLALGDHPQRILVATDCLSEGINLQEIFNAVVHYDLCWNPARHEQREGRVDRFGQTAREVRTVMLYGADNPIDGAVLKIILRKAERIRQELGISVPVPEDTEKVTEAVLEAVLQSQPQQMALDLGLEELEHHLEQEWVSLKERAKRNITLFAQRRLKPEAVLPEWRRMLEVLGSEDDVARFVRQAAERLGAPLAPRPRGGFDLPLRHLPQGLRERLAPYGMDQDRLAIDFHQPHAPGTQFIHRTHPLVTELADFLVEQALEADGKTVARSVALFSDQVDRLTRIYLLRLRHRLTFTRQDSQRIMLAEEVLAVAVSSDDFQIGAQAARLLDLPPSRNMPLAVQKRQIQAALQHLETLQPRFQTLAKERARQTLADHQRVRDAAQAKGRYEVAPLLPADVVGVFVLVPDRSL